MMEYRFSGGHGATHVVRIKNSSTGYVVDVDGQAHAVEFSVAPERPGEMVFTLDGIMLRRAWSATDGARRLIALEGEADQPYVFTVPQAGGKARSSSAGKHGTLEAQMPGVVRRILVTAGDTVERGQLLALLEAMKTEIRVTAPSAGTIGRVTVLEGQAVERGQVLIELAPAA